ncbi:MAG: LysE family transporter [Deltaproteobacteria bacterium]|nr:LysE family transporter [Deltaproteobacteria bacterium]
MPGPLLTVTVSESARIGLRAGPLLITGHAILELLLVVALVLGLGPVLKDSLVMGIVALVGGGMLVWMGIDMIRNSTKASLNNAEGAKESKKGPHPVFVGLLASLANPYWTLWWATVGLGYLVMSMRYGAAGIAVFFAGHLTADYAWYVLIALGISRGKRLLKDTSYRLIIRACGLILTGFGGWFLWSARAYIANAGI